MKKETLLLVVVALIVGLLVGIVVTKSREDKAPVAPPSGAPPAGPALGIQQNIKLLQEIVAREPANREAWVQLGHGYFDTEQPMKAIEAYDKALELDANDPNVLTDQGVMFRRLGWFDRAIQNFTRANELNPSHAQSLYNLGVVYRYDLKDFAKAKETWSKFLAINPAGPGADQIRAELRFLEGQPQGAAGQ